jgi:hypothetical protein
VDVLFAWLESTSLSVWIRESTSVFAFPAFLSCHAIGMGLAAGVNASLALRLLGVGRNIPPSELRRFVPVMWFGFWLNATSGIILLIGYPTKALTNPVFFLKLSLIAIAMATFVAISRSMFAPASEVDIDSTSMKTLAWLSLLCWTGAITSGRLLAYTYTRLLASW